MSRITHFDVEIDSGFEISRPTNAEISVLAHQLWMDRGSPVGSPDQDWLQAETELTNPW